MKRKLERSLLKKMDPARRLSLEKAALSPGDCAAIFGADPQKSAFTLWAEKTGKVTPAEPGEAARFNTDTRNYIARRFSEVTGKSVRRVGAMLHDPAYPHAYAVLHHLVLGENAGLTCEAVTRLSLGRYRGQMYPEAFYYPCLHRMMVTGRKKWYLAVLILKRDLRIFQFTADPEELRCLALGEEQFWRRVKEDFPPLPDGSESTRRTLDQMYPGTDKKTVDLSPISLQVHDYLRWQEREEQVRDALRDRAATIKSFLGDAQEGFLGDIRVCWLPSCELRLDLDALRTDYPQIDLDQYRFPAHDRAFRVYRERGSMELDTGFE